HERVGGPAHHHDVAPGPERREIGARHERAHGGESDHHRQRVVDERRAQDGVAAERMTDEAGARSPDGAGEAARGPAPGGGAGGPARGAGWGGKKGGGGGGVDARKAGGGRPAAAGEEAGKAGGGDREPPAGKRGREVLVVRPRAAEPVREEDEREVSPPKRD